MMRLRKVLLTAAAVLSLCGCSAIDKMTGQTDNTVLPGQREEAIPGRAQFPENGGTDQQASAPQPAEPPPAEAQVPTCQPDDPTCQPASADDTFSDPQ